MSKIFESYYSLLFGLLGFLLLFIPGLNFQYKIIFSLVFSSLYFLFYALRLKKQYDSAINQCYINDEAVKTKEKELSLQKEFIHKRDLFRNHDLPRVIRITTEEHGYLRDKYRGNKFEPIIADIKLTRDALEEIISREMRDFDEQLFYLQSNKDN